MTIRDGFADTVGNTPLIRLNGPSEATGCEILGKAEFLNPGSSVKDRAALFMITEAEESGALKPGGLVVESTAVTTASSAAVAGANSSARASPSSSARTPRKKGVRPLFRERGRNPAPSYWKRGLTPFFA